MLDSALTAAVKYARRNTALPGWVVEFVLFFAACTLARFAAAVWDSKMASGVSLWTGFWSAYDNLSAYADDSAVAALVFTIIVEVFIMVLARKLLRVNREEGREEGREEMRAELEPVIEQLRERIRELENGRSPAEPPTDPAR